MGDLPELQMMAAKVLRQALDALAEVHRLADAFGRAGVSGQRLKPLYHLAAARDQLEDHIQEALDELCRGQS
jgi:hypothetical protein